MKPILTLTFLCLHSFVFPALAAGTYVEHLYESKPTLPDTMLATRAKYTAWLAEQKAARAAVVCGSWSEAGQNWPAWKDGALITIGDDPSKKSATLSRAITAKRAVMLTVGFGGGDKIEVRLNGMPLATLDTRLELKRYGTSMRPEGDRRNQVLLDLPLEAGENRLAVNISQEVVVPRSVPLQFFFSTTPDPVPVLWARLRRDFPPASNRLLESVTFNWFEPRGWFDSAGGTRLEKEFLGLLKARGSTLQDCAVAAEAAALRDDVTKLRLAVTELGKIFPNQYPAADF